MDLIKKLPDKIKDYIQNILLPKIKEIKPKDLLQAKYIIGWLRKKSVKNQHIFITGAGSGIGKLMAKKFANLGANVSICDINEESVKKVCDDLNKQKLSVNAHIVDVANPASSVNNFGNIDILINNAGIVSGLKIHEISTRLINKTLEVNTIALHYSVMEVLPKMIARNSGQIVTVASVAGFFGVAGLVDYCASKFGAVGFDESLRNEIRRINKNIKTTCICPFYIDTGMFEGVKTKFPRLLPIVKEEWAAQRIVDGILQEETYVIFPFFCFLFLTIKNLLPTCIIDVLLDFFGCTQSMDDFKKKLEK